MVIRWIGIAFCLMPLSACGMRVSGDEVCLRYDNVGVCLRQAPAVTTVPPPAPTALANRQSDQACREACINPERKEEK